MPTSLAKKWDEIENGISFALPMPALCFSFFGFRNKKFRNKSERKKKVKKKKKWFME